MKKLIYLFLTVLIVACSGSDEIKKISLTISNLTISNLNGKVKSVKTRTYEAVIKFGEVTKGELVGTRLLEENTLLKYNDKGNIIEHNKYGSDGSLDYKVTFKYDDKGNIIEWNIYNADDGSLGINYTYKYGYDNKGNWLNRVEYEDGIPQEIIEREIEYY